MDSTIREIIVQAEKSYGAMDAIRYKIKKDTIETKSYTDLKRDSESFSCVLQALGEQGSHVAVTGMTSYSWIAAYLGIVNSGSVAVPLDVSLPAEEMCELVDRADATVFVIDEVRKDVAAILPDETNVLMTGFCNWIMEGALPPGTYELWLTAKDGCSRQRLYRSMEKKLTVD